MSNWFELPPTNETQDTIQGLQAGERYLISVWSVSHKVECLYPQEVEYTVGKYNFVFKLLS